MWAVVGVAGGKKPVLSQISLKPVNHVLSHAMNRKTSDERPGLSLTVTGKSK